LTKKAQLDFDKKKKKRKKRRRINKAAVARVADGSLMFNCLSRKPSGKPKPRSNLCQITRFLNGCFVLWGFNFKPIFPQSLERDILVSVQGFFVGKNKKLK
jgi:hypothetical protein